MEISTFQVRKGTNIFVLFELDSIFLRLNRLHYSGVAHQFGFRNDFTLLLGLFRKSRRKVASVHSSINLGN